MAKNIIDNPMCIDRPIRYEPPTKMYKPEPKCQCGCGREIIEGCYNWSGDYYFEKDCIINDLLRSKEMKVVEYSKEKAS